MSLRTRLQYWLARKAVESMQLPFVPTWVKTSFLDPSFDRLVREGYKLNAAVNICVTKLALAYQQPRLVVKRPDGELALNHPLQKLLNRPNPVMSQQELALFISVYKAIGGQCYLHKRRNSAGLPVQIWPYHAGQISPIPGSQTWIEAYEYDSGDGNKQRIEASEIIHLKWPSIDPDQPWMALPALRAIAREVDSDSEATRYMYALLFNDAMPRTALKVPSGNRPLTDIEVNRMKAQYRQQHGGDARGGIAILENGADIVRMSLSIKELAFDALRRVPEHRISGGFLIPTEISGLTAGKEQSTYNNVTEAKRDFYESTIMQLAELDAGELTADLGEDFGGDVLVEHDYSKVVALQENQDAVHTRVYTGWSNGLLGRRESRRKLGLPEELPADDMYITGPAIVQGQLVNEQQGSAAKSTPILGYHIEGGVVSRNEARAQLGLPPEDESESEKLRKLLTLFSVVQAAVNARIPLDIALKLVGLDIELPPPQDPDMIDVTPQKGAQRVLGGKASIQLETIERRVTADTQAYLLDQYLKAADAVEAGE